MANNELKLGVRITGDLADIRSGLRQLRGDLATVGRAGSDIGNKLTSAFRGVRTALAGVGVGLGVGALVNQMRRAINELDQLGKNATRSGLGVEAFAALQTAAKLADVSVGELTTGVRFLSKEMPKLEGDLRSLGIETRNADKSFRSVDGVMEDLSKLLMSLPEGPERSGLAMKFLGEQGAALLPLLEDLAQNGMDGLKDRARALGVVLDEETTARAAEFNDKLTEVQIGAAGLSQQLASELLPDLVGLAASLRNATEQGDLAKGIAIQLRTEWLSLAAAGREVKAAIAFVEAIGTGATQSIRNALSTASFGAIDAATPEAMAAQSTALTEAASDYRSAVEDLNDARTNALMAGAKFYGPDELNAQVEQQRKLKEIEEERARKLEEFQGRIQKILAGGAGTSRAKVEADALTPALQRLNDATQGLAAQAGGPAAQAWEVYRQAVQRVSQAGAAAIKAGGDEILIQQQVAESIRNAASIRDAALAKSTKATDEWIAKLREAQAEVAGPVSQILLNYERDVLAASASLQQGVIDQATFQQLIAAWTTLRDRAIESVQEPAAEFSQLGLDVAQIGVNALAGFFNSLGDSSTSAKEKLRDFVRSFAAGVLQMISKAIALAAVLKVLDAISPGTAAALRLSAGVKHTGGIVGMGGTIRTVQGGLAAFLANTAAPPRYHSGGIAGMKPDEVPAILQRGEEVLTKSDPRHRNNGGLERPAPGYRIVNVFDPTFVPDQMNSAAGEQVILNAIGRNPGRVKQLLG